LHDLGRCVRNEPGDKKKRKRKRKRRKKKKKNIIMIYVMTGELRTKQMICRSPQIGFN
jgi:hypothetical protein